MEAAGLRVARAAGRRMRWVGGCVGVVLCMYVECMALRLPQSTNHNHPPTNRKSHTQHAPILPRRPPPRPAHAAQGAAERFRDGGDGHGRRLLVLVGPDPLGLGGQGGGGGPRRWWGAAGACIF